VSIFVGGLSLVVGGWLISRSVYSEAETRVRLDLNAARELYRSREQEELLGLRLLASEQAVRSAALAGDASFLRERLRTVAGTLGLDFAGAVGPDGTVLCRLGVPPAQAAERGGTSQPSGSVRSVNPVARLAMERGVPVSGTIGLDRDTLAAEDPALAERARIAVVPTPRAAPRPGSEETTGLCLAAAVPVPGAGSRPAAVVYGGILLNRSKEIVDKIRETVFQGETYKGRSVGTATIFSGDLRVSTNVATSTGERAIGTRASAEVARAVLQEGGRWTDRAFVVTGWYITAYEPLEDVLGRRVGMLYVGVIEEKYRDLQGRTLLAFALITAAGILAAIGLGSALGYRILRPIQQLIAASRRVSLGDLDPPIGLPSPTEIGILQKTFQEMLSSLRERDRREKAERESQLLQSEKQASVGRLAAGIAHEINNPLTGVLTFTHMLLKRGDIDERARKDLTVIAQSTERVRAIVKGLLDFARQTRIDPVPADVNALVLETMDLAHNQALVKGVRFCFDPAGSLPSLTVDRNQMQSVILNMLINAIDATAQGGHITVSTGLGDPEGQQGRTGVEVRISDTGCGIPPENLDRIFDPFFTTKEVGKGTGLGLSVSLGIVEKHGGTIRVHSRPGQGSNFTIWLPTREKEGVTA
jgi:two-component system NtrC family sensor kinase